MSREWDRGSVGPLRKAIEAELRPDGSIPAYGEVLGFLLAQTQRDVTLAAMRTSPEWLAYVSSLIRPNTGRTNRIPVKCGENEEDWFLAFAVRQGAVELVRGYKRRSEGHGRVEYRLTGPDTLGESIDVPCLCDVPPRRGLEAARARHDSWARRRDSSRVSVLALYRAAARTLLAGGNDTRAGVQLHSLKP